MIFIKRSNPPPATLSSEKVLKAIAAIAVIAKKRKPLSKEFVAHWGEDDVRTAVWEMQHHKCCYCERKRERNRESDVEHFRPKAEVTEAADSHRGYWWLAYKWENLFFSCRYCNQEHKKNRFPVHDESKRAESEKSSLAEEDSFLIDPTEKNPEEHIGFDWRSLKSAGASISPMHVMARPWSEYGEKTIEIVGLNKNELPTERGELVLELEALAALMRVAEAGHGKSVEDRKKDIQVATSSKQRFAGFRRDFFRKMNMEHYISSD